MFAVAAVLVVSACGEDDHAAPVVDHGAACEDIAAKVKACKLGSEVACKNVELLKSAK